MDKSPLLANGYNAPPTHLNHIPAFMQMNHHPGNPAHALMSQGMPPHGIPRPDGSIIKGQNLPPAIEAMARLDPIFLSKNDRNDFKKIFSEPECGKIVVQHTKTSSNISKGK